MSSAPEAQRMLYSMPKGVYDRVKGVHDAGARFQTAKTHCPHGHEYTSENTIRWKSQLGSRRCRECQRLQGLKKYSSYSPEQRRYYHLKRTYGMTLEEFKVLAEQQHHVCAICGKAPIQHVDHDHATGQVRGLLCAECNRGLGAFADDPDVLRNAMLYLGRSQ